MRIVTVLIVVLLLPIMAFAVNLPMTKIAVTPQSLAEAIAKNDNKVLNELAFEYVATVQKMHPEVGVSSVNDFVEYLGNLELREFPKDKKLVFARVEKIRGWYEIKTFERNTRPKEKGLYDRNLGKFIASADCGNVVNEPEVPVVESTLVPKSAPVVVVQQPQLTPMPMFSAPPQVNFGAAYNDCPSGSSCGQAAWIAGQIINAGGFIGGMAVLRPPVTNYDHSFNSAASADARAYSSSSSSATGGQGGRATATGGHGSPGPPGHPGPPGSPGPPGPPSPPPPPGGTPVDPNPPLGGGGSPADPNPPR